ncbi:MULTISPECIES: ribokinase [unclassified Streptomyces]|uniref:ribokinase n=1 Tax=unclassified Streptomyces TaxID=2593676 RepID=UPI002DD91556|nr:MULTISPECIES: ribokinase [unclassified Streptomyces]WSA94587.1 ribokinase [Streptomyces sp. NBC_01795]WSB79007.1 ribokinase [Streptomyces sp. NBC_01775]WSS12792.1 ribokinase [Streptomyces sp. NBC_01186]WSS41576.1 ribokinase [Streptomyces sp. NBC_01187]
MHAYDLLVVGSANADLVVGVDRRPAAGETVLGSDLVIHPGGKGANQAAAAARLGARTTLLARVGDDAYGQLLAQAQRAAGADTAGLLEGKDAPTGVALITVDSAGDNSIVVSPGANARLTPDDITAAGALFEAAAVVSLQLEIPLETVATAARAAAGHGARVVLNPSPPAPLPEDVLALCDPLVVNEHEARRLLPGRSLSTEPEEWATALLGLGPRSVVVTLGAEGALVAGPGVGTDGTDGSADAVRTVLVPSPPVRAVDTTGAGDAFTGALGWRLGRGDGLEQAVRYAVRVGSFAVTRAGAQESYPSAAQVEASGAAGNAEASGASGNAEASGAPGANKETTA